MSNPYQPSSFDPKQFQDVAYSPVPVPSGGFGWVSQVRIVSVLNCVQGALELALGAMLVAMAVFVPYAMQMQKAGGNGGPPPPAGMETILTASYGGIGAGLLISGLVRIVAGIQNFRFRGRVLGIVSFCLGLVSMLGCYCAPTSIAVLVYGLMVYLNPAVVAAFEMGQQGMNGNSILASFAAPQSPAGPPASG
jgi:hypothetical protein